MNVILFWNDVVLEVHRRDFSRANGSPEVGGPTRVSRALAIVHAAMYNAQEAVSPRPGGPRFYQPAGLPLPPLPPGAVSAAGAVAGAAVAVLKRLWPGQAAYVDERLQEFCDLRLAPPANELPQTLAAGADHGEVIGLAMVMLRDRDGHDRPDEKVYLAAPMHHRPDPMVPAQPRLSTHWGRLPPFLIPVGGSGIVSHAAYLGSPPVGNRYDDAVADVALLGHAQALPGGRTPDQTVTGTFWGYDGPPKLGVPPRLYNQVVRACVEAQAAAGTALTDAQAAHLFALVNMAMADAAIVAWGAKYHYDLWRPVVGIREHATGYGPGNGSASVAGAVVPPADPGWLPLGIPRTNTQPGEFFRTPDFPAYPSGHATFGAAAFRTVALYFAGIKGTSVADELKFEFEFVSDEYNGINVDPRGDLRPHLRQRLQLGQAIVDNAVSRVYIGVHWRFDGLGTVAPNGLEGTATLPPDPAAASALPVADEKRLGGVAAGLRIADEVVAALS